MKHFLKETDFKPKDVGEVFALAREFKRQRGRSASAVLAGKTWAMIFSKSSTRTRVSFEVAIRELGGHAIFLNRSDIQLGRGESIEDTARVLSRFVHGLIVRTYEHREVERLAATEGVPVINALTDFLHPCQVYADAFTAAERWAGPDGDFLGALRGRKVAFLGDTSFNMANSWILGASLFGMQISLAGPRRHAPGPKIQALLKAEGRALDYQFTTDPFAAVKDADLVYTDVWTSMGQEEETGIRRAAFAPYIIDDALLDVAEPDVIVMHCLPAHRGEEISASVLEGPHSVVWRQAAHRETAMRGILAWAIEES